MISFTVRMRFAQEDRAEIAEILEALTQATRQEPGCMSFIPHWVQGDPCTALIYEQYKDEAALQAHRESPHFQEYAVKALKDIGERKQGDLYSPLM